MPHIEEVTACALHLPGSGASCRLCGSDGRTGVIESYVLIEGFCMTPKHETKQARGYSCPPFEEGNQAALVQGAYSPNMIAATADEVSGIACR
jgi:hypothetical protein